MGCHLGIQQEPLIASREGSGLPSTKGSTPTPALPLRARPRGDPGPHLHLPVWAPSHGPRSHLFLCLFWTDGAFLPGPRGLQETPENRGKPGLVSDPGHKERLGENASALDSRSTFLSFAPEERPGPCGPILRCRDHEDERPRPPRHGLDEQERAFCTGAAKSSGRALARTLGNMDRERGRTGVFGRKRLLI